jgi:hypothetical protein
MASLAEYFEKNRYKPKYFIGDRVRGLWNGIPFSGTVGNDSVVIESEGPRISVFLDLPIKYDGKFHNLIFVKHKDINKNGKLLNYELGNTSDA